MQVLRRFTAVKILVMGAWLVFIFAMQPELCYSCSIRNNFIDTCDSRIDTGMLFLNTQNRFHPGCKHGDSSSFNDPTVREGIPQSIDLEDDGTLAPHPNISSTKVTPSSEINSDHHINKANALFIPLYLLKSSFLL